MCATEGSISSYATKSWLRYNKNVFVLLLIIVTESNAYLDNINVPCRYLDSINITNGVKNSDDGSIMFEGISYPKTLYATYDYEFVNESYRQPVAAHVRGCTCAVNPLKSCVRMCCPRGQFLDRRECRENNSVFSIPVNVSDGDRTLDGNIFDFFNYVVGKPCISMVKLEPFVYEEFDSWILFKNGSISRGDPVMEYLNKNEYCFTSLPENDTFKTTLMTCFKEPKVIKDYWILIGMFLSVPFLLATIIVYITHPELRNVHGKSLVCYLCGLVVGYTTLALVKLNGSSYVEPTLCRTMGYTVYFAFMSAFFWLNVISYDLWRNFCVDHTRQYSNYTKKFVFYSIYAWGSTILMVGLCFLIDFSSFVSTAYKPGIGIDTCFLGTSRWSQFLYLYLPIILIMSCNLTFFVLISWKIRKVQSEMARIIDEAQSKIHRKNLDNERAKYGLFLRLFVVMGVTWTMEAVSWIFSPEGSYFYLTDAMNTIQGVVIFFLFVMRGRVKKLVITRWKTLRGVPPPKSNATSTRMSNNDKTTVENGHVEIELTSNTSH